MTRRAARNDVAAGVTVFALLMVGFLAVAAGLGAAAALVGLAAVLVFWVHERRRRPKVTELIIEVDDTFVAEAMRLAHVALERHEQTRNAHPPTP